MILITEGHSLPFDRDQAGDVNTQAIFTLRGNRSTCATTRNARRCTKTSKFTNLCRASPLKRRSTALRYQRWILATDADDDGLQSAT
jgi:DNA gyrase/topoisomerase IV subunit B